MSADFTMIVARDYPHARELSRQFAEPHSDEFVPSLDRPRHDMIIRWPGSACIGHRCHTIIVANDTKRFIRSDPRNRAWWDESVMTRLALGGQLIEL